MSPSVKAVVYVVLLAAVCVLGVKFHRVYALVMNPPAKEEAGESGDATATVAQKELGSSTNTPAATNVLVVTEQPAATNAPAVTNSPTATNLAGAEVSGAAASNAPSPHHRASKSVPTAGETGAPSSPSFSTLMSYGGMLFVVGICLSVLAAHDLSHLVADRFQKFILNDEGEAIKAPEYERAEQVWADGKHLEAIQLMRDYLKGHPRELYVALRIAEVYEKDLGNYLAAALEYEEVLKHRLRPEQWGWAAIHLANLYSGKLNQTDKAVALLRRIDSEYSQTTAAVKARSRLSQLEGEGGVTAAAPAEIEEDPAPPSNLPKGFRPKKG
jgi:TolA-binding protein